MVAHRPIFLGRLSIVLLIIVVGLPAGVLLYLGNWGAILVPLVVAVGAVAYALDPPRPSHSAQGVQAVREGARQATIPTLQPTFLGRLSIAMLIFVVGVPAAYLLILGTWGVVLVPLAVAVYGAPLFVFHYVAWGRAYSRRIRIEAERSGETDNPADRWW